MITAMGPKNAELCILIDYPRASGKAEGSPIAGWNFKILSQALLTAGIHPKHVYITTMSENITEELNAQTKLKVIVPLGNKATAFLTGKKSVEKYHMSLLDTKAEFTCRKAVPTFHPERTNKQFDHTLLITKAIIKAVAETKKEQGPFLRKAENYILNPSFDDTIDKLRQIMSETEISIDIETGRGQVNTMGFAWSPSDAIAINTLPKRLNDRNFKILWEEIAKVIENPAPIKILQNNIYETQVLAHYGITTTGKIFDTMHAQKFLYPEFKSNLGNVGRFYTDKPYWKDDGKVESAESGAKAWNNVRDWEKHYLYNCRDTTGTFEAYQNQTKDLKARGLWDVYNKHISPLNAPIAEMCLRGLPVNEKVRGELREKAEKRTGEIMEQISEPINLRSPKQKLTFLKAKGFTIPKKRNGNVYTESTDELSLKKLRLKHPEDPDLPLMLEYLKLNKQLTSYINFDVCPDGIMRYSLRNTQTETGRFAGGKDCFDRGVNPQTIPKNIKKMFYAPEGQEFVEVDLSQAESRFVAYDCADSNLIDMLEDPEKDIHSYVAAEIFGCPVAQVMAEKKAGDISKRQLGKKSGHGANYAMAAGTFQESCLKEMDLVLTKAEAENVLESYHRLFPGIRKGHKNTRDTLYREKKLSNPFGRERYFYGRLDPATYREAYAFRPQSTIPDITNTLLLALCKQRDLGELHFSLVNQVHDSVVMTSYPENSQKIIDFCLDTDLWHPEIFLPGGQLIIPTDTAHNICLGEL